MTLSIAVLAPSRASPDTAVATAKASPGGDRERRPPLRRYLGAIKIRATGGVYST